MHDVLGTKSSARDHKEGRGDQGPQGEAHELLFLGFRWGWGALRVLLRDDLRFPGWTARGRCQFRCGPPYATHSHHLGRCRRRLLVTAIPGIRAVGSRIREYSYLDAVEKEFSGNYLRRDKDGGN